MKTWICVFTPRPYANTGRGRTTVCERISPEECWRYASWLHGIDAPLPEAYVPGLYPIDHPRRPDFCFIVAPVW
jgi:hypothetical protein